MAAASPEPDPTSPVAPTVDAGPLRAAPFVLVVDDSDDMRSLIADVLSTEGFEVLTVPSAPKALEVMGERPPDLVITDLLMPGMSGFAFRSLLLRRDDLAHIPVVVLSGYWDRPSETLDVLDVITKPVNIDRLIETARRATGWSRQDTSIDPSPTSASVMHGGT